MGCWQTESEIEKMVGCLKVLPGLLGLKNNLLDKYKARTVPMLYLTVVYLGKF